MDIFSTHERLIKHEISSRELTQECLRKARTSGTNAYISLLEDHALEKAAIADDFLSKKSPVSRLHGIPFSLKDLFVTKGIRTTAGSKILYNYIPPYDGYISAKLSSAGGVLVGKTGCDEFGMGSTNENTPFGPVLNPLDHTRVAGGSSGGSAASVAEGSAFFSIGTDTGGSVRLPAAFCGLTGFKPTYGRVSRCGQIAYSSSLDQASPMAKTVSDIACIMEHITEKDPKDATNAPLPAMKCVDEVRKTGKEGLVGKTVSYCPDFFEACSEPVKKCLWEAVELLKKAGVKTIERDMPHLKYCVSVYYIIAPCEASANLARYDGIHFGHRSSKKGDLLSTYINSRTEGFGAEVKRRILLGTFALSAGYYDAYYRKACKVRRLIHDDFMKVFSEADIILSPVCATTAFKLKEGSLSPLQMYMNDLYTIPVNLAGLPGLALPFGKDDHGLPTGIQLIGKPFTDSELLKAGRSFELLSGAR
jgi:aspartyl-tRNA(Asn)/glutamyl-tRNA(Gln) amidotransferase subunit A